MFYTRTHRHLFIYQKQKVRFGFILFDVYKTSESDLCKIIYAKIFPATKSLYFRLSLNDQNHEERHNDRYRAYYCVHLCVSLYKYKIYIVYSKTTKFNN